MHPQWTTCPSIPNVNCVQTRAERVLMLDQSWEVDRSSVIFVSRCSCYARPTSCANWISAYWEDDWNTTPNGLVSCHICAFADPKILRLSAITLPAGYSSPKKVDFYALTRWQRSNDFLTASLTDNIDLCARSRALGCAQGGRAVGTVNHCDVYGSTKWKSYGDMLSQTQENEL